MEKRKIVNECNFLPTTNSTKKKYEPGGTRGIRIHFIFATATPSSSHPEDAEPGVRDGCVQGGAEAEPERAAGVHRVQDAVVPQAGAGEVGAPLRLETLDDGLLQGVLLLLGPLLKLRTQMTVVQEYPLVGCCKGYQKQRSRTTEKSKNKSTPAINFWIFSAR